MKQYPFLKDDFQFFFTLIYFIILFIFKFYIYKVLQFFYYFFCFEINLKFTVINRLLLNKISLILYLYI